MLGYKIASNNNTRVLVTLQIPKDARTNIQRKDIKNKKYAKYRCNKATVISIVDQEGNKYKSANTSFYNKKKLTYIVGKKVIEPKYNIDVETVCGEGIHFFLDKEVAILYFIDDIKDGEYKSWYDNGQPMIQKTYVEGKLHGYYKEWYLNGQLMYQIEYKDGKENGEYKSWYNNGQIMVQTTYKDGKCDGEYKKWYEKGKLHTQTTYKDGKYHGKYTKWFENGIIMVEKRYIEGKLHGEYTSWHEDGRLYIHTTCKDSKSESESKSENWYNSIKLWIQKNIKIV